MILTSSQSLSQLFRWLLPPLQAAQGSSVMCPLMISTPLPLLLPSSWKINTLLDFCLQAVSFLYVPSTCHVMLASFPFLPHGLGMRLMYTIRNYYISHFSWSISLTRDWLLCVWIINNHISLKKKKADLDVMQSHPTAQDVFRPIAGLVSYAVVTGR